MKGNPARIDVDEGCSWWRFVDAGISLVCTTRARAATLTPFLNCETTTTQYHSSSPFFFPSAGGGSPHTALIGGNTHEEGGHILDRPCDYASAVAYLRFPHRRRGRLPFEMASEVWFAGILSLTAPRDVILLSRAVWVLALLPCWSIATTSFFPAPLCAGSTDRHPHHHPHHPPPPPPPHPSLSRNPREG